MWRGARTPACRVDTPVDTSGSAERRASTGVSTLHTKVCATSSPTVFISIASTLLSTQFHHTSSQWPYPGAIDLDRHRPLQK